jgi:D-cysteine desulfhydrase
VKKEQIIKMFNSPEHALSLFKKNCNITIKRDDLIPYFLGGNKVRKNVFILDSLENSPDVIITNGGVESNHARVCALMASQLGIDCHLVLHGDRIESSFFNGNSYFTGATDCKIEYVPANAIASTISRAAEFYNSTNKSAFIIPGGGHCLEGAKAYVSAVKELESEPDFILFASGTGATHAGILAGVKKRNWQTKVIGISVARQAVRGIEAINELYRPLCANESVHYDKSDILFIDDYIFGGYGKYNTELLTFLKMVVSATGVPFDPVYTGKALFGMVDLIEKRIIPECSDILFWHTGGLLNLQAAGIQTND